MRDHSALHRALAAGNTRRPAAFEEDRVVGLASGLEGAADAYARTADLLDQAEAGASGGARVRDALRARMSSLRSECRGRADGLIDTPAETRAGSAAKRRALIRYWEVDIGCDARAFRLLASVCADADRLDTRPGTAPPSPVHDGGAVESTE